MMATIGISAAVGADWDRRLVLELEDVVLCRSGTATIAEHAYSAHLLRIPSEAAPLTAMSVGTPYSPCGF
jgi:hypothetical protein